MINVRSLLQVGALALTSLALIATEPPRPIAPPCTTVPTGAFTVGGTCGWDSGVNITTSDHCVFELVGGIEANAGAPQRDAGRFDFDDPASDTTDAGRRVCKAFAADGGFDVTCERCPPTGTCVADCTATFTP